MRAFRADWVLPISDEPRADSWIGIERGRIVAVGEAGSPVPPAATDLGRVAVLPALVNAHTHLELSHLHGRIPRATQFTDWIRQVIRLRQDYPDPADARILDAARAAIRQAREAGTALVGDISNTLVTHPLLVDAGLPGVVFYELLGFNRTDPERAVADARAALRMLTPHADVRTTLAAHAPYSVSPALFQAIRSDLEARGEEASSVHLGESAEEVQFLHAGTGPLRAQLEDMGRWVPDWEPPACPPVEYLDRLGFLGRRVLVVHGVQLTGSELDRLRALDATLVSCPRSNEYVGVGAPPLEAFYAMDVNVAFGTDSLASVGDLNLFSELAAARRTAPRVSAGRLLESATLSGARALGFEEELGSIDAGKRASLIAVRLPEGVGDVEEYLVSGIEPAAITWLDA
jgi:cytosine/adenosine deaminase-related metal-dependent hydrolase